MNDDKRVTVITVNFASSAYLERLLESLATEPVDRVIVWDNYSSDDERDRLASIAVRHPPVQLHFGASNLGFGGGVNAAVATLSVEDRTGYLWVLNPDTIVSPGAASALVRSIRVHNAAIVSPLILVAESDTVWYSGGRVDRQAGRSEHFRIGEPRGLKDVGYDEVTFVSGAAPLFTWDAWQMLGGFDDRFFLYCEDADLSIRAIDSGLRIGVERSAIVHHAEGGSSTGGRGPGATFYYYVQRNRLVLYRAFTSRMNLLVGNGIAETARLTILPFRPLNRFALSRFGASMRGIAAGIRGERGPQ